MTKHVILGAGGSVGNALAYELLHTKQQVRLVSRSGVSIPGAETFQADLRSYRQTLKSIQGADTAYLTVGLPYDARVWDKEWPIIMRNTIDACKEAGVKLIFFDNVYMYGKVKKAMTENTPYNPCSKKGEIRARVATMLEEEMKNNNIRAVIARSADLYGPHATQTSLPFLFVIDKLMKGKKAQWLIADNRPHSFTYTIDAAKGMALLAAHEECHNQVWHLPTDAPALTGRELIETVAQELDVAPDYSILKKWMIKMAGFFNRTTAEVYEMLYQNEDDYIFDSTKFNTFFDYKPKPYREGIKETIRHLKQQ